MKKQRNKLDKDRFCNNVIPIANENNIFSFVLNSRSHRRQIMQRLKKGKPLNNIVTYNRVKINNIPK